MICFQTNFYWFFKFFQLTSTLGKVRSWEPVDDNQYHDLIYVSVLCVILLRVMNEHSFFSTLSNCSWSKPAIEPNNSITNIVNHGKTIPPRMNKKTKRIPLGMHDIWICSLLLPINFVAPLNRFSCIISYKFFSQ